MLIRYTESFRDTAISFGIHKVKDSEMIEQVKLV